MTEQEKKDLLTLATHHDCYYCPIRYGCEHFKGNSNTFYCLTLAEKLEKELEVTE